MVFRRSGRNSVTSRIAHCKPNGKCGLQGGTIVLDPLCSKYRTKVLNTPNNSGKYLIGASETVLLFQMQNKRDERKRLYGATEGLTVLFSPKPQGWCIDSEGRCRRG